MSLTTERSQQQTAPRRDPGPERVRDRSTDDGSWRLEHLPPRRQDRVVQALAIIAMAAGTYYLVWRLLYTINTDVLWLSLPLWLAEAWALAFSALFFLTVWNPRSTPPPPAPPEGATVDVFVPTYNEPLWVVRRTLLGVQSLRYPHTAWLLDDGDRPEMRQLAEELGVRYLAREGSEGAKAGNINAALEHATGDFIAIFDADHVPLPNFLDRTLGYFRDDRIAYVQTPQEFYNLDSYQHGIAENAEGGVWHEQSLFFRVLQPGKDRWNAVFFCGSCAVIRREAVDEVGGFPTETVTEDLHLSMLLQQRGWHATYQREVLAYGIAPQDPAAFHSQRLRWGQGAMQVLRRMEPATTPGFSPLQRLNYVFSTYHWFDVWKNVVFYFTPLVFLFTGLLPVTTTAEEFLPRFLLYYVLILVAFKAAGRGYAPLLLNEGYTMIRFPTYIRVIIDAFMDRDLSFEVTDKSGKGAVPKGVLGWYIFIAVISFTGVVVGASRLAFQPGASFTAFFLNGVWAGMHCALALWAWRWTRDITENRRMPRAGTRLPVEVEVHGRRMLARLDDVNERGARVVLWSHVPDEVGESSPLSVHLWPIEAFAVEGRVTWRRDDREAVALAVRWEEEGAELHARTLSAYAILAAADTGFGLLDASPPSLDIPGALFGEESPIEGPITIGRIRWQGVEDLARLERGPDRGLRALTRVAPDLGETVRMYDVQREELEVATVTGIRPRKLGRWTLYDLELDVSASGWAIAGSEADVAADTRTMNIPVQQRER